MLKELSYDEFMKLIKKYETSCLTSKAPDEVKRNYMDHSFAGQEYIRSVGPEKFKFYLDTATSQIGFKLIDSIED